MKILYPNHNIFDKVRWQGNTKEKCSCIFIVVPSKTELLIKKKRQQHEGYYGCFYCLLHEELEIIVL